MRAGRQRALEVSTGAVVSIVIALFLSFVFGGNEVVADGRYEIRARFSRVDGLTVGANVRAAGIEVGKVTELMLDGNSRAIAVMRIDLSVQLDTEASAAIVTESLFGQKFVRLDIGGSDDFIQPGGEIVFTEEALILDDLLQLIVVRGRKAQGVDGPPDG